LNEILLPNVLNSEHLPYKRTYYRYYLFWCRVLLIKLKWSGILKWSGFF